MWSTLSLGSCFCFSVSKNKMHIFHLAIHRSCFPLPWVFLQFRIQPFDPLFSSICVYDLHLYSYLCCMVALTSCIDAWTYQEIILKHQVIMFLREDCSFSTDSTCLLPCAYLAVCANNSCLRWWNFSVLSIIALFKFLYAPSSTSFYDINELDYVTSEDILKVDDNWIEIIHARSWNEFGSPLLNMSSEWIISLLHLFHFLDIFVDEKFFSLLREH